MAGTVATAALVAACGGSTVIAGQGGAGGDGGSGGSSSTSTSTSGTVGKQPPPPPDEGVGGTGPDRAYVFHRLWPGDTDRNGTPSATAWKQYGYNLDGKISTKDSTDLCQPYMGGSKSLVYPDGDGGIDNSFGKILMALFSALTPDFSAQLNETIASGDYSYLIAIDGLGSGASYLDLPSRGYEGSQLGGLPMFDGSDLWPVQAESLDDPAQIASAKVQFPQSYVSGDTWVSHPRGPLQLTLALEDMPMVLPLGHAVVTMELSPDRSEARNGIIAGVIEVEAFIEEFQKLAGHFSLELCEGTTFDSLADQLRQSADILSDGTQDPTRTCDAISVGLGFEATAVQLGPIAPPKPPVPDPCDPGSG